MEGGDEAPPRHDLADRLPLLLRADLRAGERLGELGALALREVDDMEVTLLRVNEGTTLVLDGQANVPLRAGDRVSIARHHTAARFIGNPGNTYWRTLVEKMRWAAPPAYRE